MNAVALEVAYKVIKIYYEISATSQPVAISDSVEYPLQHKVDAQWGGPPIPITEIVDALFLPSVPSKFWQQRTKLLSQTFA